MKNIFIFVMLSLTMFSCQDIDLYPKDTLSDVVYWKNSKDFCNAVNNLYPSSLDGWNLDIDSDIAYDLSSNSISNGSYIASNDHWEWDNRFANIRTVNVIISKQDIYSRDKQEIARYIAEARFFRAYCYWKLMKYFGGVPIITKVLDVDSPELMAKRNTQKEVENFILEELRECSNDLPLQSEMSASERGRITKGTADALRARVALFAGTWAKYHNHRDDYETLLQEAIDASNLVINSKEYHLFNGVGSDSYRHLFIDKGDDSNEDILSNRYYKNIRTHTEHWYFAWGMKGTPTKKMADMYLCKDGLPITKSALFNADYTTIEEEFANRDPRMTQTFLIPGRLFNDFRDELEPIICPAGFQERPETRTGYKLWKFIAESKGVEAGAYDCHLIRYAEVLLILAEATYERTGMISDEILNKTVNEIRNRIGVQMPPLTNRFVRENKLDMLLEIRRERTVELAFEGYRRDDLRRWKIAEDELKQSVKGIKYSGTEYEEKKVVGNTGQPVLDDKGFIIVESDRRFVSPKNYYYSLPLGQLFLNPNLNPNNPGW